MPVPVASMPHGARGPSTLDKLKMGGMMGGSVGLIIGFIFGFTNIVRFGPGPNGMLRTLGHFFMAIGTTIRTDSSPIATEAFGRVNRTPTILQRQHQSLNTSRDANH
ncbi:subunit of TIM23 translocase complex [Pleosporales sp. CAS-2024a]